MHILIIGATGRNGALVQAEALSRGHTVTTLVRDPSSLTSHPDVTLVRGTPLSLPDIRAAFRTPRAPDAVVVALNPRRLSDSPFAAPHPETPPALIHDSVRNALEAMRENGVRKIVINSMQGIGASSGSMLMPLRVLFEHTNMKYTVDEHRAVDELMNGKEGEDIDWIMVRPPMLTEGEALPIKNLGDDGKGISWLPKITRKSVAAFIVDVAENPEWKRRAPVITN
ncbi:nad-dependent epimerase dehydratase [Colletotrichum karsti]|uniref:Nad-dependent epimerase dehydratase n=1 Tax=Colletotrichum karsti TaxID=1095194 RepID=A0A9P6IE74_9PEZI|nr:nad-dependent epimerase dehydratase [Colletotrichum karsti]KAF9878901.1 nad-dependent epimerase dehydratase [Colletotrichum karsti]